MKIRKTYLRLVSVLFFSSALAMACAPAGPMPFPARLKRKHNTKVSHDSAACVRLDFLARR